MVKTGGFEGGKRGWNAVGVMFFYGYFWWGGVVVKMGACDGGDGGLEGGGDGDLCWVGR